jgi:hypothetical protein
MRMQGFGPGLCFTGGCTKTVQQWNADFTAALLALLGPRFAGIVRVEIIEGPQQCPLYNPRLPELLGQLEAGDCPLPRCPELMRCPSPWANPALVPPSPSVTPTASPTVALPPLVVSPTVALPLSYPLL